MRKVSSLLLLAACCAAAASPDLFNALRWRNIGPFRGGRVVAVTGIAGDPATFYFGSVGGGVWKTTNVGMTWSPVFDGQPIASIGAIAAAPSNPNVLYAGTGETDIRSQIGFGDGVYRSTDAGKTWTNVGLRDTRAIGRILVHPANPDVVYVAALGHQYGPNAERGVFRSMDGGRSWSKVLFTTPDVGAVDLAWDAANPKTIYATMWNAHRPPWSQYAPIEGPGSGLWKTVDGGDHWTQVTGHGLPASMWRRSGVAVAPGGRRVYLLLDAQSGAGMYRSDDGGATWRLAGPDQRIVSRGWYFGYITLDPKNPDVVYAPNVALYRSTDGGASFTVLKGAPGGDDYHALWVDPAEPRRMILGADQGATISVDGGASWSTWYNQPTAQLYHVTADDRFPYMLFASQQDSGAIGVPSRTNHGMIDARDWVSAGGCEAGYIAVDPRDNDILYVGDAGGTLARFDRRTGESQNITPWPVRTGGPMGNLSLQKYRFPWTAPLTISRSQPDTIYYGAQMLLKSTDGGMSWRAISPDLTGDTRKEIAAPAAVTPENAIGLGYGVIYSIAASELNPGLIWTGSDTGLVNLTNDGGRTWRNVTPAGLPAWSRVTQIEASHWNAAEAWITVDRHRMEDYKPYIYRTRDGGQSWTAVTNGLAAPAYVNGIREDPVRRGLLYAATELGVAMSFDEGDHWQSLQLNLPAVSVRDLIVHGDDLAIATHGRGFWVLDDITPLRQVHNITGNSFLYEPAPAIRVNPAAFFGTPLPPEEPQAKNPPTGAIIDYWFQSAPGEAQLQITDAAGNVVRRFSSKDTPAAVPLRRQEAIAEIWIAPPARLTANAGMNRFVWDLKNADGVLVVPDEYILTLIAGDKSMRQPLVIKADPRSKVSAADLAKQYEFSMQCVRAMAQAMEAKQPQAAMLLRTALAVAQSADRTPPASAYAVYEEAMKALPK